MTRVLIGVSRLAAAIDDAELRIADVRWYLDEPQRGRAEYEAGHIPGAVYFDLDTDLSVAGGPGRHPLPAPDVFADTLGHLGIGNRHTVVAYDSRGGVTAARLWWMLRSIGHEQVAVLDGGIDAWTSAGSGLTTSIPRYAPVTYRQQGWRSPIVDRRMVADRHDAIILVDARSAERFRGDVEPVDPVAGHIPGAVNVPCEGNLGSDGRFLSPPELRRRFKEAGVTDPKRSVAYCGSGVTACHNLLAMELAGMDGAALYPGSWSDWSTAGMPVNTGG